MDFLDNGSLNLQYNRHRYYDYYTGRWTTQDPLGITPNSPKLSGLSPRRQYADGLSLYEYNRSNPLTRWDPLALLSMSCPDGGCPADWLKPLPSQGRTSDWHWWDALSFYVSGVILGSYRADAIEFSHESAFAERLADYKGIGLEVSMKPLRREVLTEAKLIAKRLPACACTHFALMGISPGYAFGYPWDYIFTIGSGRNDKWSTLFHTTRCCVKRAVPPDCDKGQVKCRVRFDMRDTYSFDDSPPIFRRLGRNFDHFVHIDKTIEQTFVIPEE